LNRLAEFIEAWVMPLLVIGCLIAFAVLVWSGK